MKPEDIIQQYENANLLVNFQLDVKINNSFDLLDLLASAGLKLMQLSYEDFDEEGVSVVSKACMYACANTVENSHYSLQSFKDDEEFKRLDQIQESFDEDEEEKLYPDIELDEDEL
jgi:hypothetical protein